MTYSQAITEGPDFYWHKCGDCGAETEGDYGQDAAAAVWNRRVTAASAQARIDAVVEQRDAALARADVASEKVTGLYRRLNRAEDRATAAEARADRLAEIASKLSAAISWLDYPFIDNRTPEAELRQRVGFMMKDAEPHRVTLQQETQP